MKCYEVFWSDKDGKHRVAIKQTNKGITILEPVNKPMSVHEAAELRNLLSWASKNTANGPFVEQYESVHEAARRFGMGVGEFLNINSLTQMTETQYKKGEARRLANKKLPNKKIAELLGIKESVVRKLLSGYH